MYRSVRGLRSVTRSAVVPSQYQASFPATCATVNAPISESAYAGGCAAPSASAAASAKPIGTKLVKKPVAFADQSMVIHVR